MSTFYAMYPPSAAGSSNPSIGVNGTTAPTSSTEVAGINPSGNLQPLQTDSSGNLLVSLAAEPVNPFMVDLTQVGGSAISLGQKAPAASLPVVDPSNGVNGSPIPADSTMAGMRDTSGNTTPLIATSSGYLGVQDLAAEASLVNIQNHTSNIDTATADIDSKTPTLGQKTSAGSSPVVIASDQSSIPVTVASVPLPTGASTAALQSNVQSAPGTPQTVALTIQGNASGIAVPISAAALPLPTGAATSANQTNASQKTQIVDGSGNVIASTSNALNVDVINFPATQPVSGTVAVTQSTSPWVDNLTQVGGSAISLGSKTSANSLPVVIASDQGAVPVSGTVTANQGSANATPWNENISQYGGSATSLGQKTSASSIPVVLASDQSALSTSQKGRALANAPTVTTYGTPVTSAAYTTIVASTTSATNLVELFDSSGVAIFFAVGAAAAEVNQFVIYPGGNGQVPLAIPAGSRISYKAVSTSASGATAYNVLNLYT